MIRSLGYPSMGALLQLGDASCQILRLDFETPCSPVWPFLEVFKVRFCVPRDLDREITFMDVLASSTSLTCSETFTVIQPPSPNVLLARIRLNIHAVLGGVPAPSDSDNSTTKRKPSPPSFTSGRSRWDIVSVLRTMRLMYCSPVSSSSHRCP